MELSDSGAGPALVPRGASWETPVWLDARSLYTRAESTPGAAQEEQGIGIVSFLAAFVVAVIIFAIQATVCMLLRKKLARIL